MFSFKIINYDNDQYHSANQWMCHFDTSQRHFVQALCKQCTLNTINDAVSMFHLASFSLAQGQIWELTLGGQGPLTLKLDLMISSCQLSRSTSDEINMNIWGSSFLNSFNLGNRDGAQLKNTPFEKTSHLWPHIYHKPTQHCLSNSIRVTNWSSTMR